MTIPDRPLQNDIRPTRFMSLWELLRLSIFWLGLLAVVNGIDIILQERIKELVPDPTIQYTTLGIIQVVGVLIAVLIQPIAGSLSDYTSTRFGRRKPYIVVGALLNILFLIGIATSNTIVAVGAFVLLLQLSAGFAQGPFQGYVPDLVPASRVGLASGLVGLFTVLGVVVGTTLASIGLRNGDFTIPTITLGIIQLVTLFLLVFRLDEGRPTKDRAGRSWRSIAAEAWGRDALREPGFVNLVASRFFILGGGGFLFGLLVPYLERSQGLTEPDERALFLVVATSIGGACTLLSTLPAARLADQYGRKRVIYAACLIAALGMTVCAVAPSPALFIVGNILTGVGLGSFLAVDWALMSENVPKASAGRYMGIANVATATNGVVSALIGGVLVDALVRAGAPELGPRIAFLLAPIWFALGAFLLRPVPERRRS